MGLSDSKRPTELIHLEKTKTLKIPVIKRFSGGGTVFISPSTFFISFILNKSTFPSIKNSFYPSNLMLWTETLFKKVFNRNDFSLKENDYTFGIKKFAGNAQMFSNSRAIHHTSFLWDLSNEGMSLLKNPKKQPKYREERNHLDFLVGLSDFYKSRTFIEENLKKICFEHFSGKTDFETTIDLSEEEKLLDDKLERFLERDNIGDLEEKAKEFFSGSFGVSSGVDRVFKGISLKKKFLYSSKRIF